MKTMTLKSRSSRGFTLTEAAIVLGIVGLILSAIWAAAASVYANMKTQGAERGITATVQNVRSMFGTSSQSGIPSGTTTDITTPGMFPTDWQSTTVGKVGNPWNTNVAANSSYVIGNGSQIVVELDGIPDSGCAALVGYFSSAAAGANGGAVTGLVGSKASTAAITAGTPTINAVASTFDTPKSCKGGTGNVDSFAVTFDMAKM